MSQRDSGGLRIAQVAPPMESVPPQAYGGTERVVAWLTDELVRQGHEVTVYGTGDSETSAHLVPVVPSALRGRDDVQDVLPYLVMLLEQVAADANRYDIIHFHTDHIQYPLLSRIKPPGVTTMHGRMDLPDLPPLFEQFPDVPLVSISMAQREPLPWLNWVANIPHGMPAPDVSKAAQPGSYLAFLGRTSPEKGLEEAIQIARHAGMPLRVAAKIDPVDEAYYDEHLAPKLAEGEVEFIGEIGEDGKPDFLCGAAALLFPIRWPEPFGLVMIEAAACGTPVLAFRSGSVPEVIEEGVTGMIVDDVGQAIEALPRVLQLPRERVREATLRRFSAERMAQDYVALYRRLIAERGQQPAQAAAGSGVADLRGAGTVPFDSSANAAAGERGANKPA
jgi:glycosyltransferase involved in cell wall biosynthesis